VYQHHGIACSDGIVIHFGRGIFDLENAVVEQVDMDTFCQGRTVEVVESAIAYSPVEVIARATSRLGESKYDIVDNHCEHFVNWCRSGLHESQQSNLGETVARQSIAIAAKPLIKRWLVQRGTGKVGAVAAGISRGPVVAASVADAVQATAEVVANRSGKTRDQSRKIGRRAGVASSAVFGWAIGGPVVAAAGIGFWVAGQVAANHAVDTGKQILSEAQASAASRPTSADESGAEGVEKV